MHCNIILNINIYLIPSLSYFLLNYSELVLSLSISLSLSLSLSLFLCSLPSLFRPKTHRHHTTASHHSRCRSAWLMAATWLVFSLSGWRQRHGSVRLWVWVWRGSTGWVYWWWLRWMGLLGFEWVLLGLNIFFEWVLLGSNTFFEWVC